MNHSELDIRTAIPLSAYTTIGLGGNARYFVSCRTSDEVYEALSFAAQKKLRVHVLGGGSNTIFADAGFDGLIIKIDLRGLSFTERGNSVHIRAGAGEDWDRLVQTCVDRKLTGIECLSGIPGLVGATPIQNVGAYGQEVGETIVRLKTLDRRTLDAVDFTGTECGFGYRMSRFKAEYAAKFVITEVEFRLAKETKPEIRYPELQALLESTQQKTDSPDGAINPASIRAAVLALRRKKSMVIDPADPNTKSVGSFFMNPVVSQERLREAQETWERWGGKGPLPTYPAGENLKIPAAWLVENAGYRKGYRKGAVGVSDNHSLALVNRGGTARELLDLAAEIQEAVAAKFSIRLDREPVVVT
jgi:UDP-N-acetylmuramate dehydrogenase